MASIAFGDRNTGIHRAEAYRAEATCPCEVRGHRLRASRCLEESHRACARRGEPLKDLQVPPEIVAQIVGTLRNDQNGAQVDGCCSPR
jgi:hypothetical protein